MRAMKDSGVEWIGEIPEGWNIGRVKHAFYRKNEKAMQDTPVVLSLARSGVRVRDVSTNEGQIAESYFNYNPVSIDDLLINPMDLYSGANCSIAKVEGVISPAYINLRHKAEIHPVFYDYYFKIQYWLMAFFAHGKGVSYENRWTLNAETLMNYPIVTLHYKEQYRIADYLDVKCAQVDAVIAKQQEVIEKLKSYKLSVITEAVTKGLNPNAPIKDSGIEWIGKIPMNWTETHLKYLSIVIGDGIHSTPEYDQDGEYFFLNGNSIGQEHLVFKDDTDRLSVNEYCKYKKTVLTENTILVTLNGATYGKTSFYNGENVLLGKSAGYITLQPHQNKEYIRYYLQSYVARVIMELSLSGTTIANLSLRTLNEFYVILPESNEQQKIVSYLNRKTANINNQIENKQTIIDKLTAYKKSLIYEVVTGKKEV